MRCPQCSHDDTKVLESRLGQEGRAIRRRRSCVKCQHRFTTYERSEEPSFQVQKKDGRFEPYQREKVLKSVQIACRKRPITIDEIEALLDVVERRVTEQGSRTISSQRLGHLILESLHSVDPVAYVRFASVYKEFDTPMQFLTELQELTGGDEELSH